MSTKPTHRTIVVELLALDLDTCSRCTGTSANLAEAVEIVATRLHRQGTDVRMTRHVVKTAAEAERLRFVSSPTVRIDGRDIALEFRESNCACGDFCGCEGGVDCRVWVWQNREYLEAPTDMIVEALLAAHAAGPKPTEAAPYVMPQNLQRYFASTSAASAETAAASENSCCDRTACCEAEDHNSCCGSEAEPAATEPCGCR